MINFNGFTKVEILKVAKSYGVVGAHDKNKQTLIEICTAHAQMIEDATKVYCKENLKKVVQRNPSLGARGLDGRIIRAGKNLSGNVPFKRKFYMLDASVSNESTWTEQYKIAFNAAPKQVRHILKYMANAGLTSKDQSNTGPSIAEDAKVFGELKSVIDGDKLFAYYRRAMETLGLIYVGSYADTEERDEDSSDEVEVENNEEETED